MGAEFWARTKGAIARLLLTLTVWTVVSGTLSAGFLALAIYLYTTPPVDKAALWAWERDSSYTIVDQSGEVLAIRGDFHGEILRIADMPPHLVQAFLAIEDHRFYTHHGIDPMGLLRALIANLRAGATVQGGSTITQQVAKNLFLTPDRSLSRKLSEFVHAIWLERHLTKDEILSLYLNRIYLGAGTYGVDAAARFYFDKPATEVSLREAAILAGLPKSPTRFAPTTNLARSWARARLVLGNMRRFGFITPAAEAAARSNPAIAAARPGGGFSYFVDAAIQEADRILSTRRVPGLDVVVTTTIDLALQAKAEAAVSAVMDAQDGPLRETEAALVAIDRRGRVTALIGGRDYGDSQFNRATQARRQPGSAFKPFVYLAALENGVRPTDPVFDEPIQIGDWSPENYGRAFRGRISVRQALAQSVNSVAVRLSSDVGVERVIEAATRLGISTEIPAHRSIALGTHELTLLELTGAYLPFALNGMRVTPHLVTEIRQTDGTVLFSRGQERAQRVIGRRIAEDMTHMLYQVVYSGTGTHAQLDGHPAAGKTGTSQESRDAWFIGYTGHQLAGVWVGNDDATPMGDVTGATLPADIWRAFMSAIHEGRARRNLPGGRPAAPDRFDRRELRDFLRQLQGDLEVVRADRGDWLDDPYRRGRDGRNGQRRPRWCFLRPNHWKCRDS